MDTEILLRVIVCLFIFTGTILYYELYMKNKESEYTILYFIGISLILIIFMLTGGSLYYRRPLLLPT